jgi:hypothetical protein
MKAKNLIYLSNAMNIVSIGGAVVFLYNGFTALGKTEEEKDKKYRNMVLGLALMSGGMLADQMIDKARGK